MMASLGWFFKTHTHTKKQTNHANKTSKLGQYNAFEKYARQIGSSPQVGVKIKNIWNHHLAYQHHHFFIHVPKNIEIKPWTHSVKTICHAEPLTGGLGILLLHYMCNFTIFISLIPEVYMSLAGTIIFYIINYCTTFCLLFCRILSPGHFSRHFLRDPSPLAAAWLGYTKDLLAPLSWGWDGAHGVLASRLQVLMKKTLVGCFI